MGYCYNVYITDQKVYDALKRHLKCDKQLFSHSLPGGDEVIFWKTDGGVDEQTGKKRLGFFVPPIHVFVGAEADGRLQDYVDPRSETWGDGKCQQAKQIIFKNIRPFQVLASKDESQAVDHGEAGPIDILFQQILKAVSFFQRQDREYKEAKVRAPRWVSAVEQKYRQLGGSAGQAISLFRQKNGAYKPKEKVLESLIARVIEKSVKSPKKPESPASIFAHRVKYPNDHSLHLSASVRLLSSKLIQDELSENTKGEVARILEMFHQPKEEHACAKDIFHRLVKNPSLSCEVKATSHPFCDAQVSTDGVVVSRDILFKY